MLKTPHAGACGRLQSKKHHYAQIKLLSPVWIRDGLTHIGIQSAQKKDVPREGDARAENGFMERNGGTK